MPNIEGQLFGSLVLSGKAHAKLTKVDFTPTVQVSGVVGYVDMNDLEDGPNIWGSVVQDDPFFAKGSVHSHGMICAGSAAIPRGVAQLVDVQYEELPPILTISEAIGEMSFFQYGKMLIRGKPTGEALKDCDFIFKVVLE